jgi:tRNA A-37 threonylcarbamoyl transferase component Bud32/tetratricopeptide (TPR) repeat protein
MVEKDRIPAFYRGWLPYSGWVTKERLEQTEPSTGPSDRAAGSMVATMADATDTSPPVAPSLEALPSRIGRYEIVRKIGQGAVGVVVAARDPELRREVAIKILHDTTLRARTRLKLEHEAQALARLAHPNIVRIFDAGHDRQRLFLVMELVTGRSLGEVLRDEQRLPWRRALEIFIAVARALSAAHAAGIVHGDLKPDNVLVGEDGTIKVADFGLARFVERAADDTTDGPEKEPERPGVPMGTRALGTPAYMAPELFATSRADEATDQFALCVSLWESMYGQRPFEAESLHELVLEVMRGHVRPPPAGLVPAWLHRVAARGLRGDRASRYATIAELGRALERGVGRRRRLALAGVAAAASCVALAFVSSSPTASVPCRGAEARWDGVWDDERRAALEASAPHAADALRGLGRELDEYAVRWANEHRSACEATQVEHVQPAAEMDRRIACLEHQREAVALTLDALESARGAVTEVVPQVVARLPSVDACREAGLDPAARRRGAPADLWARIDALSARTTVDHHADDLALLDALVADARASGDAPVLTAALQARGSWHNVARDFDPARRDLEEAFFLAQASGDDATAADLAVKLVLVVGVGLQKLDEGRTWVDHALASAERAGDRPQAGVTLHWALAELAFATGEYEDGLAHAIESATRVEMGTPTSILRAQAQAQIGSGLLLGGRAGEALPHLEAAIALRSEVVGPRHASLVISYSDTAAAYSRAGELDRAIELLGIAKEIVEQPEHAGDRHRGRVLVNLGAMLREAGRDDEAEVLYRGAITAFEHEHGPDHPYVAYALNNLGTLLIERDNAEAVRLLSRALDLREGELGPDHPKVAIVVANLARAAEARGDHGGYTSQMRRAIRIEVAALGVEHPETKRHLGELREHLEAAGRDAAAIEAEIDAAIGTGAESPP